MSVSLLKHNAEMLVELGEKYDVLVVKRVSLKGQDLVKLEGQLGVLKNQILFLLTAVKKLCDEEKNGN